MSFGGKKKQKVENTSRVQLNSSQRKVLNAVTPIALDNINNPTQLPDINTVPDFNAVQQGAQQGVLDKSAGQLTDLSNAVSGAAQFNLNDVLSPSSNPFLQATADAAARPVIENLNEQILPQIGDQALAAGQFGGSRQGIAEGIASRGALDTIGDQSAQIYSAAYGQGLDQQARTLGLLPAIQSGIINPEVNAAAVGGQQQSLTQAQLRDEFNRDLFAQTAPFNAAQESLGLVMGVPTGSSSTSIGAAPSSNPFTSGLGGAAAGASLGSIVPGIGTGIGAGIGGAIGILGSLF